MIDTRGVLKYKSLGYMIQRSRSGGANYVHLSDYDALVRERDEFSEKINRLTELLDSRNRIILDLKTEVDGFKVCAYCGQIKTDHDFSYPHPKE